MSEPRPTLGEALTEEEELLLRSALLDVPPASGKRRALAAVGVAAAITTAAGTGGATAAATRVGVLVKWIAVGAIGGAAAYAVEVAHPGTIRDADRRPPSAAGLTATGAPASAPAAPRHEGSNPATAGSPPMDPSPPSPPRAVARAPEPPPARATLAAEVSALDDARRALASGDADGALRDLDAYDRSFARQRLRPEAIVLRIEVLLAQGHWRRARDLEHELTTTDPGSAYAKHVRSLLANGPR
jgi:hypothetical protein